MKGVKGLNREEYQDNVFYVCTLIEYIVRKTKNHRQDVVKHFTINDILHQLEAAPMNHCLSLEQVSDEVIEDYHITEGTFDTVKECRYQVPSETAIGRVYQSLVLSLYADNYAQGILDVFASFISDEISDFNSNVYYSNPDYLKYSFQEGYMLA